MNSILFFHNNVLDKKLKTISAKIQFINERLIICYEYSMDSW